MPKNVNETTDEFHIDPESTALLNALVEETQAGHLFTQRPAASELETQTLS